MSIMDQPGNESPQAEDGASAEAPKKPIRNFKRLFEKENRSLLLIIGGVSAFVFFAIVYSVMLVSRESERSVPIEILNAPNRFGNETNPLRDAIDDVNESQHGERQKLNPSAQPIPRSASEDFSKEFDDDVSEQDVATSCSRSDTVCMRLIGLLGEQECAPEDHICEAFFLKQQDVGEAPPDHYEQMANNPGHMALLEEFRSRANESQKVVSVVKYTPQRGEVGSNADTTRAPRDLIESREARAPAERLQTEQAAQDSVRRIARMGDQFYAVSQIALNSKVEGDVSLEIVSSGVLNKAQLSGKAIRVDNFFRIELDRALLGDGRECTIQATALDKETTLAAVRSGVNHHIIYRYGFWGVGTVMSAMGSAARSIADRDVVVTNQGAPIVVERADVNREIRIAIGELGSSLGQDFKRMKDTPATVFVKPNEEMGVFLARSILTSDCQSFQDENPVNFYSIQEAF